MKTVRPPLLCIALTLALAGPMLAQDTDDSSHIVWLVVGGGGVLASCNDDGDTLSGTLAQTGIDSASIDESSYGKLAATRPRASSTARLGFWLPRHDKVPDQELSSERLAEATALALRAQPNPFGSLTTISYELPAEALVRLEVFDASGKSVRLLLEEHQSAGSHEATWNGDDNSGQPLPSGSYIYQLKLSGAIDARYASGIVVRTE